MTQTNKKTAEQKIRAVLGDVANSFVITAAMEKLIDAVDAPNADFILNGIEKEGLAQNVKVIEAIRETGSLEVAKVEKAANEVSQGAYGTVAQQAKTETKVETMKAVHVSAQEKASTPQQAAQREKMIKVAEDKIAKKEEKEIEAVKLEKRTSEQAVVAYKASKEAGMLPAPYAHNKIDVQKDERGFAKNLTLANDFAANRNMIVSGPAAMQPKPVFGSSLSLAA